MKLTLSFLLTFFLLNLNAQDDLYLIDIKWKVGDTRTIETKATTQVYINGELYSNTDITSLYEITVVDLQDDYIIKYKQNSNNIGIEDTQNSSVDTLFQKIMYSIQEAISEFEYLVKFDKEEGIATEVVNIDKVMNAAMQIIEPVINEMSSALAPEKRDELLKMMKTLIPQMKPEIIQTTLNGINYIFQGYTYPYLPNDSYTQEIEYHDINALGPMGDKVLPALMTVTTIEKGEELILKTTTDVDKQALLEALASTGKDIKDFKAEDMLILEETEHVFDYTTSWIKSHTSVMEVQFKDLVTMKETSITTFK